MTPSRAPLQRTIRDRFLQLVPRMILLNAQVAKDCGISEAALQTLHIISLRGRPMHPSELAEATALPRSTITRILDALEAAGFVTREAADDDKRRSLVAIRAERAAPVAARFDRYARAMARADDAFTDDELRVVARYWELLADRLDATWNADGP